MEEFPQLTEDLMAEVQTRLCLHCFQKIHPGANVCHHCSNAQTWWRNFVKLPDVISLGALLIGFLQLTEAFQANTASQAARRDVCGIAKSLIDVAEMLPRTSEGGAFDAGGLPEKDKLLLQDRITSLRKQISECK
jgi:hypothetical protein